MPTVVKPAAAVAVAVDLLTETASRRLCLICRHRRRQWVWWSRADDSGEGGGGDGGSVDKDGVSECGAVKLASVAKAVVVHLCIQTA